MFALLALPLLTASVPTAGGPDTATVPDRPRHFRAGQIIIVGNTDTRQAVILAQLPFASGYSISARELQQAERNLAALNLFQVKPRQGIRPTVEVIDLDRPGEYKDVVVTIRERPSNRLRYALTDLLCLPFTGQVGWALGRTLQDPCGTFGFLWAKD